jgi:capsular polysaccharide export protein
MEWNLRIESMRPFPQTDPPLVTTEGDVFAIGFPFYKKATLEAFFAPQRVRVLETFAAVVPGCTVAVWGGKEIPQHVSDTCQVVRLEDGFLRSVGLGADLIRPLSWVMDRRGMYFDARQVSDLEFLLENSDFSGELQERAASLRARIVQARLTKYNVGQGVWHRPSAGREVILVPGQVETDASMRYGSPHVRSNLDVLQRVRAAHPQAYVIYKPHPDVTAGLRLRGDQESDAVFHCDEVVVDVSMDALLEQVDAVHVMTSLTGFEALLRGRRVICYGHPFYAGWGLTEDVYPLERRSRRLSLDQLVAGALIMYPRYMSLVDGAFITPEQAVDELVAQREQSGGRLPWWRRIVRPVLQGLARIEDGARRRRA